LSKETSALLLAKKDLKVHDQQCKHQGQTDWSPLEIRKDNTMIVESVPGTEMDEDRCLTGLKDKRRSRRVLVNLPMKVRGINAQGVKFEEMTQSIDVSSGGTLFLLKQPLSKGMDLELSLPMPRGMRKAGSSHSVYHTAARVIRINQGEVAGVFRIAVRFHNAQVKKYHLEGSLELSLS
jgi:PilZ domain